MCPPRGLRNIGNGRQSTGEGGRQGIAVGVCCREPTRGIAVVLALEVIVPAPVAVVVRQVLDDVLVGHRARAPGPTVAAGFAGVVEVVEQYEALRQGVLARCNVVAEQHETWIAIALRQVAQHLIVGAILLDDVDHVGNAASSEANRIEAVINLDVDLIESIVGQDLAGVSRQLAGAGYRDSLHRANDEIQVVVGVVVELPLHIAGIGMQRLHTFCIGHQQPFAIRADDHARGIPTHRDKSFHRQAVALHIGHRDGVQVAHGSVERALLGRQPQCNGRRAEKRR